MFLLIGNVCAFIPWQRSRPATKTEDEVMANDSWFLASACAIPSECFSRQFIFRRQNLRACSITFVSTTSGKHAGHLPFVPSSKLSGSTFFTEKWLY